MVIGTLMSSDHCAMALWSSLVVDEGLSTSAQVVRRRVYKMRQFMKDNSQICLTIGPKRALISFYY